jgi:hypothetical protein
MPGLTTASDKTSTFARALLELQTPHSSVRFRRRLCEPEELRASSVETLFNSEKVFGKKFAMARTSAQPEPTASRRP